MLEIVFGAIFHKLKLCIGEVSLIEIGASSHLLLSLLGLSTDACYLL